MQIKLIQPKPRLALPQANDNEAIKYASFYGHTEIIRLLLADSRIDPLANDGDLLKKTSRSGYTSIVNLLLAMGDQTGSK